MCVCVCVGGGGGGMSETCGKSLDPSILKCKSYSAWLAKCFCVSMMHRTVSECTLPLATT